MPQRASELQIDAVLTAFSVGYKPQNFISETILPVVGHTQETGVYYAWDKERAVDAPPSLIADGTLPNTVTISAKKVPFAMDEYGLESPITDREERNAPAVLDLRQTRAAHAQDMTLLDQERRATRLIHDTVPSETLSGAALWSDPNADIEGTIDDAREQIRRQTLGYEPNTIVIPPSVAKRIKRNHNLRELIKYTQSDLLVNGDLPPTMFGMRVVTPNAMTNVGTVSSNAQDVWGNDVLLAYINPNPELRSPSLGYTIRLGDWTTYERRDPAIRTNYVRPCVTQTEVIAFPGAGLLLKGVLG